jgi:hypothetical protein
MRALAALPAALALAGLAGRDQTAWLDTVRAASAPTDAPGLAEFLRNGTAGIHSAHLTLSVTAAGVTIDAEGDETLDAGRLRSLDLSEDVPGAGRLRVVVVGGETYVRLPEQLRTAGGPWVRVTPDSSDPVVRQLASSLSSVADSGSLDQYTAFTEAATITGRRPDQVDGETVTHYTLDVDVTRLPGDLPGRQELMTAGLITLPVDLWVDSRGRPVKVSEKFTVQGQRVESTVTIGDFDEPVTVTAPAADQVAED